MSQELAIPAVFQSRGVAKAFQNLVPQDDNLADGIGQSYPIIAYKGKIWSLRHRGERKIVTRKDDGSPSGNLDVIILKQAKTKSKSFYRKYDPATSDGERPICASMDSIVPDIDVEQKQSETCALCPRNVWKTDPETGRRGRECTDYKRLAVLVMPYHTQPLFGQPLLEPMFLRVPPDSLNSLAVMGDTMVNQGYHYSTYLTRITFDPQKAHPSMIFRPVQPLGEDEAGVVIDMQQNAAIGRIIGEIPIGTGMRMVPTAPVNSLLPGTAAPPPATAAVTPQRQQGVAPGFTQPAPAEPEPEPASLGLTSMAPTKSPAQAAAAAAIEQAVAAAPAKRGRKPAAANGQNTALSVQAPAQVPDAGAVEPTDDELDAEIAKMIAQK